MFTLLFTHFFLPLSVQSIGGTVAQLVKALGPHHDIPDSISGRPRDLRQQTIQRHLHLHSQTSRAKNNSCVTSDTILSTTNTITSTTITAAQENPWKMEQIKSHRHTIHIDNIMVGQRVHFELGTNFMHFLIWHESMANTFLLDTHLLILPLQLLSTSLCFNPNIPSSFSSLTKQIGL